MLFAGTNRDESQDFSQFWGLNEMPTYKPCMYKISSLLHKVNSKNYRADEFEGPGVVSIGCSDVYGIGIDQNGERFSGIVAHKLGVRDYNLGMPGKSNDYIARMAFASARNLDSVLTLVVFTDTSRREYCLSLKDETSVLDHQNYLWREKQFRNRLRLEFEESAECLYKISNNTMDMVNFLNNYFLVEHALRGKKWLFSINDRKFNTLHLKNLESFIDKRRYVGCFEFVDKAFDENHPGLRSHSLLAEKFLQAHEKGLS